MNFLRRQARLGLLALLILSAPLATLAQEGEAIRLDGSRIVSAVVGPLSEAYAEATGASVSLEISGTSSGLDRLCNNEIDIALAAEPMTRAQEQACAENDVEWVEVLVGYDALAIIANPTFAYVECLSLGQLSTLLGPAATGTVTTWGQVSPQWESPTLEFYAPTTDNSTYNLLDELLPGDGLRSDLNTQEDPGELVSLVAEDVAGVGFAPLSAVTASEAEVLTIALDGMAGAGCVAPEQSTLEDGSYPAARGLLLYVNAASLDRDDVAGLVEYLLTEDSRDAVAESGFVPTSEALHEQVQSNVVERIIGRQFTQGEPLYTIPLDISGELSADAAAGAYQALNDVTTEFTNTYADVTASVTAFGSPAAYRKLCNGEIDLAAVTRSPTEEEAAVCEENGITLWEVPLGHRAVVMLVPAEAEFAACLTTDQIATLWQDQGDEDTVTNWSQLGEDFPDLPLTLFLPRDGESQTDFLLFQSSGEILNPRRDALQTNNDPLWRAAATANVEGAITYVDYASYTETEAEVIPVAVDAGEGCVEPSLETIRDGSYLFTRPIMLQVSMEALARPEVQSLVWYLLRDASRLVLEEAEVIPLDAETFTAYQQAAVQRFSEAEAAAAAAEEATPTPADEGEGTPTDEAPATTTEEAPTTEEGS